MTKTLTYSSFAIASLLTVLVFITAKTYSQLAIAVILYPTLIFLYFKIFPRRTLQSSRSTINKFVSNEIKAQSETNLAQAKTAKSNPNESVEVTDFNRRSFIKLIWATGISFLMFSLLGRRLEALVLGNSLQSGIRPAEKNDYPGQTEVSPTEGHKISEIDEGTAVNYYGFTNKDGAWLIMKEDTNESSFRYAKGTFDFPGNWKNRENLKYDYFHNLF